MLRENNHDPQELTTSEFSLSAALRHLPLSVSGSDRVFRDELELLLNASMMLERQKYLRIEPLMHGELMLTEL